MSAPGYKWQCKKCTHINAQERSSCEQCGISAHASPDEINPQQPVDHSAHFARKTNWWIWAFPEWLIAACLTLAAPVWSVVLASQGKFFEAALLLFGTGCFGYVAYIGVRENRGWLTYFSIFAIVVIGYLVGSAK
jgi:hypothetical protein